MYFKLVKIEFMIKPEKKTIKSQSGIIIVLGTLFHLRNPVNKNKVTSVKVIVNNYLAPLF